MFKASVEAICIAEVCCENGQIASVHIIIIVKVAFAGNEENAWKSDVVNVPAGTLIRRSSGVVEGKSCLLSCILSEVNNLTRPAGRSALEWTRAGCPFRPPSDLVIYRYLNIADIITSVSKPLPET